MSTPEEAIRNVLADYCHTLDDGRFDDFAQLWADDAEVHVMGNDIVGRDAITAWMTSVMPPEARGKHVTVNSLVTVTGEETASSVSDFLFVSLDGFTVSQAGRYLDTLALGDDGTWRFRERRIELSRDRS